MGVFRSIQTGFWKDPKVIEEMTPEDKLFFLYIMTNPNTTQIGIYKITKKQMAFELGYSLESINALVDRFEKHHKLIKYNTETRTIAIKNWGKYNLNRGGKPVIDCIKKELSQVNDIQMLNYVRGCISRPEIAQLFDNIIIEEQSDEVNEDKQRLKIKGENKNGSYTRKPSKSKHVTTDESEDDELYKKPTAEELARVQELLRGDNL